MVGPARGRIDAVTLAVKDLDVSRRFYVDVIGLREVRASEAVVRFDAGGVALDLIDESVLLEETGLAVFPRPPCPVTLVIEVARDEVDDFVAELAERGVGVVKPVEDKPLGPRIGYVKDPDGHLWEIGAF
jgi:catechol 2,3-dioxygenase-like lactoylglutathione lyase family enzyme